MIRVANAPCSWGVQAASRAPYGQVLDEIAATGYTGTELGDWGFMPTDPAALHDETSRRNLRLIAAFVPVALANASAHAPGIATAVKTARLLARRRRAGRVHRLVRRQRTRAGARVARRAHHGGGWPHRAAMDDVRGRCGRGGARGEATKPVCEPSFIRTARGYVETAGEIDELMRRTDPSRLGLCLDTGHLVYAGADPLPVLADHVSRVWHVHFKDCDPAVAQHAREQGLGYLAAVRSQLFCELGRGSVDFAAVAAALANMNYDGWIVVEQDVFPGYGSPGRARREIDSSSSR